ncbi:MAG: hypothetical protein U5N58_07515 [Actinomycetota bacterium]|nr:hypothetical protein [Actinomycetota bacterium]
MRIADLPKYELKPEELEKVDQIISRYKGNKGAIRYLSSGDTEKRRIPSNRCTKKGSPPAYGPR